MLLSRVNYKNVPCALCVQYIVFLYKVTLPTTGLAA